eukprot:CAMPEP_0118900816 /NCGR_PEP_ID=MMETSP1166-20130328/6762_1 /TAXON_ID=1104430 /ORGANISM="Chrysoreinhardia sp, Strain CCMP3193" /LENGTH=534 /DNA_ID=CAMNT_0006839969 /DNA_START=179 /DNA_END=1786 /DNA_ORIENTATION=+
MSRGESGALIRIAPEDDESSQQPKKATTTAAPLVMEKDPWSVALRVFPLAFGHALWAWLVTWLFQDRQAFLGAALHQHVGGVGTLVHGLLGGVLGLLTAFRTNQAYGRYWRATEAFGELRAGLVAVARKLSGLNDGDALDKRLYRATIRHLLAMPIAVKHYLRGDDDFDDDDDIVTYDPHLSYVSVLNSQELSDLVEVRDAFAVPPPHALFASLYVLIRPVLASDDGRGLRLTLWSSIATSLDKSADAYSVLKTIRQSAPPRSYALHVRRFLMVWLATLPVALLSADALSCNPLGAAVVAGASAWALYSTDELAHIVGQPFDRLVDDPRVVKLKWRTSRWLAESRQKLRTLPSTIARPFFFSQRKRRRRRQDHSEEDEQEPELSAEEKQAEDEYQEYASSMPTTYTSTDDPPKHGDVALQRSTTTTFPLDEWADSLITTLRHHVLVHSVLDRRIRSRTWVVQPEACVQKPPPSLDTADDDDDDDDVLDKATTVPKAMRQATTNSTVANSTHPGGDDDDPDDDPDPVDPDVVNDD